MLIGRLNSHNSSFTQTNMDITAIVVSIPFLITLLGFVLSIQNFKLNKKKDSVADVEREKESEARLVRMEADIVYIRQVVDGTRSKLEHLENRVNEIENHTLINEEEIKNLKN